MLIGPMRLRGRRWFSARSMPPTASANPLVRCAPLPDFPQNCLTRSLLFAGFTLCVRCGILKMWMGFKQAARWRKGTSLAMAICPTRVGMNRICDAVTGLPAHLPHVCGDELANSACVGRICGWMGHLRPRQKMKVAQKLHAIFKSLSVHKLKSPRNLNDFKGFSTGAPGGIRTHGLSSRSRTLYPLSYGRKVLRYYIPNPPTLQRP